MIKLNKYLENKTYQQDDYEWTILNSEWSNTYHTILVNIRPKHLKNGKGKQIAKGPPKTSEQMQDLLEAISCVGAERWATSNIRKEIRDIVDVIVPISHTLHTESTLRIYWFSHHTFLSLTHRRSHSQKTNRFADYRL